MTRTTLPQRRRNETSTIGYRGNSFDVTVGFNEAGHPKEVFATGPKDGSDMAHVLSDACVLISVSLQHGIEVGALAKSLGTVPELGKQAPASPIGAILGVLLTAGLPRVAE